MTNEQRRAISLMNERNLGAVLASGRWVWKQTIREDEQAARDVIRRLAGTLEDRIVRRIKASARLDELYSSRGPQIAKAEGRNIGALMEEAHNELAELAGEGLETGSGDSDLG